MKFLHSQLSELSDEEISVAGRHGDFGPWNILVTPHEVTVLDFLGYQDDPLAIDILKMLVCLEDEKKCLTSSKWRIEALCKSFLEGYGQIPHVSNSVVAICETLHRVCSLCFCICTNSTRFHNHIERYFILKNNLHWLLNADKRKSLWPVRKTFQQHTPALIALD